jgi:hypothetical protein
LLASFKACAKGLNKEVKFTIDDFLCSVVAFVRVDLLLEDAIYRCGEAGSNPKRVFLLAKILFRLLISGLTNSSIRFFSFSSA